MQECPFGDAHDFLKFALLRHLQRALGVRVGINWYLAPPDAAGDGRLRTAPFHPDWRAWDADLAAALEPFRRRPEPFRAGFPDAGLLPADSPLFTEPVVALDRRGWHQRALRALARADLVFLDPGKGFLSPSMRPATAGRYALFTEAADYRLLGKTVIGVQYAARVPAERQARNLRDALASVCPNGIVLPILRARVVPNTFFATVCPPAEAERTAQALLAFADHSPLRPRSRSERVVQVLTPV
jgi:hypothetical protein